MSALIPFPRKRPLRPGDRVAIVREGKTGTIEKFLENRAGNLVFAVLHLDGGCRRVVALSEIAKETRP
jgi:hypothetical protein